MIQRYKHSHEAGKCQTCVFIRIGTGYPGPVCYELKKHDGKPVATLVKLEQKACYAYRMREGLK